MVLILGFVAVTKMDTNLLPNVSTPYLMVVTVYPGASPERVESEVSDVLENALTVPGVSNITATSAENYSLLLMKFVDDTDMNSAMVKVSNKLDQAKNDLPSTCLTPSVIEYSLNMNAFMTVAVSREGADQYELSEFIQKTLVPELQRRGGVSSVSSSGLVDKMVQVQLNQDKINDINAKLLELIDTQLAAAREQLEAAEAQITTGRKEYEKQLKNFGNTVSNSVMSQMSTEVGAAVETVRAQAQALLESAIDQQMQSEEMQRLIRQNIEEQMVSSEVQRLSRLVRNMLTLSQIEAGERTIQPTEVEITSLVTNTLLGFEQRLDDKHIEVEGLDTDRYWVLADADLIQQVVYNLIDNAVKFVNEGGTLSFDFYTEGENIMVAVRNTGSGVLPEEIPRLFDRFYKTDRSRSLDKNGVGLGLSICRTIMNIHEGEIFVRSQPGEYTEFVFGLKADPAHYKKGVNRKAPPVDASFTTLPEAPAAGREEKQHDKPQQ